jgi:WD40 repeat protein
MTRATACLVGVAVALTAVAADPPADPLPQGAVARTGTARFRHGGVDGVAFVAADRLLSTGGGVIRLWDTQSARELNRFGSPVPSADRSVEWAAPAGSGKAALVLVERDGDGWARRAHELDLAGWTTARRGSLGPAGSGGRAARRVASPDGRVIAEVRVPEMGAPRAGALTGRYEVWLWDPTGATAAVKLDAGFEGDGHVSDVRVAFTADGKTLVTADDSHHLRVWDVATTAQVRAFGKDLTGLQQLAVAPDGKFAATAGAKPADRTSGRTVPDPFVRLWDVTAGTAVRELVWDAWPAGYYAQPLLAFTPDGRSVVAARGSFGRPLEVYRWSAADGARTAKWTLPDRARTPVAVSVSPDGQAVAVAFDTGTTRLFELDTGKEQVVSPETHDGAVVDLAFTADGRGLLTVGTDGTARRWDAATGRPAGRATIAAPGDARACRVGPDASFVAVRGERGKVRARDAAMREVCDLVTTPAGTVCEDGETVVSVTGERHDRIRVENWSGAGEPRVFESEVFTEILAERGGRLLVRHHDQRLALRDLAIGKSRPVCSLEERRIVRRRGGDGATLTPPRSDLITRVAMSADATRAALVVRPMDAPAGEGDELTVLDLRTGDVLWRTRWDARIWAVGFSPDARRLAVGGFGVTLFDAASGKPSAHLDGHNAAVSCLSFSRDGKRLASGSDDGTALVWDVGGK